MPQAMLLAAVAVVFLAGLSSGQETTSAAPTSTAASTPQPPPTPSPRDLQTTTTFEPPAPTTANGTYAPIETPAAEGDGSALPLEAWVIVLLVVAAVIICGLMVYAAKRGRAKKKSAAETTARMAKEDKEFDKRIKNLDKL
jgi:flagellar basal body-associated protein FliL